MIEEWDSGHLPEVGRKAERDQVEIPMIKGLQRRYIISIYQENIVPIGLTHTRAACCGWERRYPPTTPLPGVAV